MPPRKRRHGEGSVYQLADGRWQGKYQIGWLPSGSKRAKTVTGHTQAEVHRKLDRIVAEAKINGFSDTRAGTTVKTWAEQWLAIKEPVVRPNTFKGYRTAVTKWIIPTVGHRKLTELNPGDMRAVGKAATDAGRNSTTAHLQTVIFKMILRDAINEGHSVPVRVLQVKAPPIAVNDRRALILEHSIAVKNIIDSRPDRARWLLSLQHGLRQGEALGLLWEHVNFAAGVFEVRWELSTIPDGKVPPGLEHRRLYGAKVLIPPKSKAGARVHPITAQLHDALLDTPRIGDLGLVFPRADGLPQDSKADLATWHEIQDLAGVRHPSGRYYGTHELRHTAATEMIRHGVDAKTQLQLLGHTKISTTGIYQHPDMAMMRAALERITGSSKV